LTRVLAVDLGTRRIGVALSDPAGAIASPLETIIHRERHRDLAEVARLARAHGVSRIVIGWPRNMDGTSGPAAKQAEAFARALRQTVDAPVDLWDERLSTAAAERALRDANVKRGRRRAVRDQVAAALILQAYLTARPWERDPRVRARDRSGDEGR
jgi:putative holliday junction resolvase